MNDHPKHLTEKELAELRAAVMSSDYQKQQLEKAARENIWASDIWDGASYETNEFGDNWKRGPKTDKELERECRSIELWEKLRVRYWFWPAFLGWPWVLLALAYIFHW